jgi:hypothetical protein
VTLRKGSLTYDVNSAWPGRPEPPGDVGKRFLRTLELLEPLHPTFHDWYTVAAAPVDWEDPAEYPLPTIDVAALGPDLSPWVVANVRRDDFTRPDPDSGYLLGASSHDPSNKSKGDVLDAVFCAGGKWVDHGSIDIGSVIAPPNPALVTYPIFRGFLLAMVSVWSPPWVSARCSIWGRKPPTLPGLPPFPYSGFQMPWISYFRPEVADKLGPLTDLMTERTPDGGLLITATTDKFDPTNPEHMRPSQRMAEMLIEHATPTF